jgi:phosphate-selective porin OprO/OprP
MPRNAAWPTLLLALPLLAAPAAAFADDGRPAPAVTVDAATLQALLERLDRLEARLDASAPSAPADADAVAALTQRLAILERKLELAEEAAAAKAPTTPAITVDSKGVAARSAEGGFEVRLRGNLQVDQRTYVGDVGPLAHDGWLARRIEPILEGSFGPLVGFRLKPDFAGDSPTLSEAYVDLRFDPAYTLRVGKFKSPVGLERLQSSSSLSMIERSFPTELAPNQELGVQLQGELAEGSVGYAIGAFNGAPDGRDAPTTDVDDDVEFAGRVFFEPWKNDANALSGLGFGLAASAGDKHGVGGNVLPRYRTPGQLVFASYRAAVAADGRHVRWSPQAYYYRNRLGLLGEYIRSAQDVTVGATHATLANDAWQLTGSWVLTGEEASYKGVVKPNHPFAIDGDGWGAFELVARVGELDVDDDAFPLFADPSLSATRARTWGLGLNWYLNQNLKLVFNHVRTNFDAGAPAGADRDDETLFFSRVQVAF